MITNIDDDFFEGKRPWSKIKDRVLGGYLVPYLKKVQYLGKEIILVDCFAGPGKFEDGEIGSPLMICQIAEKNATGKVKTFLFNNKKDHHNKLESLLTKFIENKSACPIYGDAKSLLEILKDGITDQTIFVYLDPFGLKDFDFSTLFPYLSRSTEYSTELIINVSVPIIHRLSGKNAIRQSTTVDQALQKRHDRITLALGGDYWKDYIFNEKLQPADQIKGIVNEYTTQLKKYLPFVGSCIVKESTESSAIKYFIVFASRHIDSAVLLNDIMFDAYHEHIWKSESMGTLFESQSYEFALPKSYYQELENIILGFITEANHSRIALWRKIVTEFFMKFKSTDFRKTVNILVKAGKIEFKDTKGTGRLNDESVLINKT